MDPFVRNELEASAVEHLKWTSREASMATIFMLQTALQKANVELPKKPKASKTAENVQAKVVQEKIIKTKEERANESEPQPKSPDKVQKAQNAEREEMDFGLAVSGFGPSKIEPESAGLLPSMATTLENFNPLFEKVQSQLSKLGVKKNAEFDVCPERSPRNLSLEVAALQKEITQAAETLQRRKVVYLIMRHDDTGIFTDKHVELFERMLNRNERDAEVLREKLRVTSATLHDATRVLQASGDRLYSLDLLDKQALSEWEKFGREMGEFIN